MDERLIRAHFNELSVPEKAEMMKALAKRYQMNFKEIGRFSRWGRSISTGIFEKDGAEFVFVPGDTVTLGWAGFSEGLTADSAEELREVYEEFEFEGTYEEFLGSFMTPVRDVTIPPMLVEREPQEPCWEDLTLDDPRLKAHPEWLKQLEDAIRNYPPFNGYCSGPIRFTKLKNGYRAEFHNDITYSQLLENLAREGYSLPTADEWAYLCGSGCRTLFPWGDGIRDSMHLRHFDDSDDDAPYDLEQPNFFGIKIAFDPYKSELIHADSPMSMGGDGGGNICGGLGLLLGYLPCSPHYKPQKVEEPLDGDWYSFRRIIRIE